MGDRIWHNPDGSRSMATADFSFGHFVDQPAAFQEYGEPQVNGTGIWFRANITEGFSGGPVVNPEGQLVGVLNAGEESHNSDSTMGNEYAAYLQPAYSWLAAHGVRVPG